MTAALVADKIVSDPEFADIVEGLFVSGRKLDRGNANWANVCDDFGRFGVSLADELRDLNRTTDVADVPPLAKRPVRRIAWHGQVLDAYLTADLAAGRSAG